ncbi:hypothetical protein V202x_07390 [Gimesia aquarii]|uniref:Uncharacterized protein n=1 Tax=Gimesia aquarii TaxID=2527964 RepID=A0A517WQ77_9PLAN|nr:hypothetical protein V202x_07390 [Gimesia aquarii]
MNQQAAKIRVVSLRMADNSSLEGGVVRVKESISEQE